MPARWESIVVDDWLQDGDSGTVEPLGGKEKFWITGPDGVDYLFKYTRCDADGSNVRGEDWAEWTVHELAELIGVPTAVVVPATFRGRRGILSRSVLHEREQLIHGNELLARQDSAYDAEAPRENAGYTVDAVYAALEGVAAPDNCEAPVSTGFAAWAGYVTLDAWVSGRDRHHENWAVIDRAGSLRLAPSFDHGNALGFQVQERRLAGLAADPRELARWSLRGTSPHFAGRPQLVTVAGEALRQAGDAVRTHWLSKIAAVTGNDVGDVFDEIPDAFMSEQGRIFRTKLLTFNQERIIDDC